MSKRSKTSSEDWQSNWTVWRRREGLLAVSSFIDPVTHEVAHDDQVTSGNYSLVHVGAYDSKESLPALIKTWGISESMCNAMNDAVMNMNFPRSQDPVALQCVEEAQTRWSWETKEGDKVNTKGDKVNTKGDEVNQASYLFLIWGHDKSWQEGGICLWIGAAISIVRPIGDDDLPLSERFMRKEPRPFTQYVLVRYVASLVKYQFLQGQPLPARGHVNISGCSTMLSWLWEAHKNRPESIGLSLHNVGGPKAARCYCSVARRHKLKVWVETTEEPVVPGPPIPPRRFVRDDEDLDESYLHLFVPEATPWMIGQPAPSCEE